jgi:hypothetical protein
VSVAIQLMLSVAIQRRDDRALEYVYAYGWPTMPEGYNYLPPLYDTFPADSSTFDGAGGVGGVIGLQPVWDDRIRYGGYNNYPYRITGIVIDSNGDPVSNTTLSLFRTSDDAWIYDAVSGSGGQYDFGVSDTTTTYYIVAFNSGLGTQGVTVNTLVGS